MDHSSNLVVKELNSLESLFEEIRSGTQIAIGKGFDLDRYRNLMSKAWSDPFRPEALNKSEPVLATGIGGSLQPRNAVGFLLPATPPQPPQSNS